MLTACVAARVQAHPVLGTPFFGVHPCRTAELMALLLPGREVSGKAAGQAVGEVCLQVSCSGPIPRPCRAPATRPQIINTHASLLDLPDQVEEGKI